VEVIVGIAATVVLIAVAILIAVPHAVEVGIRRALPDSLLRPDGNRPKAPPEPTACLQCGTQLKAGDETCRNCGWSYAR
jgi:hypothetical protein